MILNRDDFLLKSCQIARNCNNFCCDFLLDQEPCVTDFVHTRQMKLPNNKHNKNYVNFFNFFILSVLYFLNKI